MPDVSASGELVSLSKRGVPLLELLVFDGGRKGIEVSVCANPRTLSIELGVLIKTLHILMRLNGRRPRELDISPESE